MTAVREPRPSIVLVSSAGVERNARATTPELRAAEIPIGGGGGLVFRVQSSGIRV